VQVSLLNSVGRNPLLRRFESCLDERFVGSRGDGAMRFAYCALRAVWLHRYNWHRPHGGIKSKTSISRLSLTEDNLLRFHS
jgi:hypothetical protein